MRGLLRRDAEETCFIGFLSFEVTEPNGFTTLIKSDEAQSDCFSIPTELQENQAVSPALYPNPAGDRLIIHTGMNTPLEITLLDLTGRALLRRMAYGPVIIMDTGDLPRGMYVVDTRSVKNVTFQRSLKL